MKGLEDQDGLSEKIGEPPQVPEKMEQGNRVLVLPVNGESRKITQILSNETSLKILELLGEKSMSTTDIAEKLNLPLTTVKYNLDSLVETDLIKVKQIRWSKKGRQVKVYESVEKLIVLVPSKSSIDKLSIINILQKYIGVIVAAFFAAAGIEYFSAYIQAKRIFDATAPLRMGDKSTSLESTAPENSLTRAAIAGDNESKNVSQEMVSDQQVLSSEAVQAGPETLEVGTGNVYSGSEVGTGNISSGLETGPSSEAAEVHASSPVHASIPNVTDSAHNLSPIPPEGLAHAGGGYGLYEYLSLHPGVWFLFGCIFIIVLIIVREVYYKKRAK